MASHKEKGNISLYILLISLFFVLLVIFWQRSALKMVTPPNTSEETTETNTLKEISPAVVDPYKCIPTDSKEGWCQVNKELDYEIYSFIYPDRYNLRGIGAFNTNVALVSKEDESEQAFTVYVYYFDQERNKGLMVENYDKFEYIPAPGQEHLFAKLVEAGSVLDKQVLTFEHALMPNKQILEMTIATDSATYYMFDTTLGNDKYLYVLRFMPEWEPLEIEEVLSSFNVIEKK